MGPETGDAPEHLAHPFPGSFSGFLAFPSAAPKPKPSCPFKGLRRRTNRPGKIVRGLWKFLFGQEGKRRDGQTWKQEPGHKSEGRTFVRPRQLPSLELHALEGY